MIILETPQCEFPSMVYIPTQKAIIILGHSVCFFHNSLKPKRHQMVCLLCPDTLDLGTSGSVNLRAWQIAPDVRSPSPLQYVGFK